MPILGVQGAALRTIGRRTVRCKAAPPKSQLAACSSQSEGLQG
jgi:hypothetical protein